MTRVLLVDLGTPRDEISEPLGIETLASYIEDEFSDQVILDLKSLELDNLKSIEPYLVEDYQIIGFSTKIRAYDRFKNSMEAVRKHSPNSVVIVGDILGTYAYDEVLKKWPEVICVRGEGEDSLVELLRRKVSLNDALSLEGIPNLAYLQDGQLVETERRPFDTLRAKNPKRILATEVFEQHGIGRLEGSRGCAYAQCGFCGVIEKYAGPDWKPFSLDFVLRELQTLSDVGFVSPYFTDEDFFGDDISRIYKLADRIAEAKENGLLNPEMDFYINLRANSVLGVGFGGQTEAIRLLRRLKDVGLRELFVGVESGCKDQLARRYRKGVTKQRNIEAMDTLRGIGFEIDLGFIFFDQDSSVEELRENLAFVYEAGIARHDSQLIKKIRIEPRTPIGLQFAANNGNTWIDLNAVEYPYRFKYSEVEKIFNTFNDWQKNDMDVVYNLQSFCRGEIPKGYARKDVKDIIAQYRELDVQFLDAIVGVFEQSYPLKDAKIKEITQSFENRRNSLDSNLIQRIQWLSSHFRRFKI